jgi:hypothetical protein
VACAHNRHGKAIRRAQTATQEQQPRGIVNFFERGGVSLVVVGENLDRVLSAEIDQGVDVDISLRGGDGTGELGPDPGDLSEAIHGGVEDPFRCVEPGEECLANAWSHPWNHGQKQVVSELLVVNWGNLRLAFGHDWTPDCTVNALGLGDVITSIAFGRLESTG